MNLQEYEQIFPHVTSEGLVWATPNTHVAWRVETLRTKEPDTFAWIESMTPDDVLYDVGANIGQYSLLAAKRGVTVHAFEPESQNFALLCKNIAINKLQDQITPWCLALSDKECFDLFHVTVLSAGNSCNSFGDSVDFHLKPKEFAFKQGCYATTLDAFYSEYQWPTHVKIDVDGFEHRVLAGARVDVLRHVKSVLVETNTHLPEHQKIEGMLAEFGLLPDKETAEIARRKEGPFTGIGNVIYYREGACL